MIRIDKPDQPPSILKTKGKAQRCGLSSAYSRASNAYQSGSRKFSFDSEIYAHDTVKRALLAAQHDKCAFCESKITHISYGDVEHFRPKAGYRQNNSEALSTPGYYWLAYEWDNLLLSCQLCNQRYKKNLFPLVDPATRATSHHDDLTQETPLFIQPAADHPEQYISFRREIPYAINDNARGESTIKSLGLDRTTLNERRLDRYEVLRHLYILIQLDPSAPESVEAQAYLARVTLDSAEYANMAKAALAAGFSITP